MPKRSLAIVALAVLEACGPSGSRPDATSPEASEDAPRTTASTAETSSPAATSSPDSGPKEAPAAKKKTKEDLDKEMAPPANVMDVRPLLGTDPDSPFPEVFAKVKQGMTAKELDAIFPGVGAVKQQFVNFTTKDKGKRWTKVSGNQPHKELLDIEYDDAGGLKKIAYMFDEAVASDEFWQYLKKAAVARFGETDTSSDLMTWKSPAAKQIHVHKGGKKIYSFGIEF